MASRLCTIRVAVITIFATTFLLLCCAAEDNGDVVVENIVDGGAIGDRPTPLQDDVEGWFTIHPVADAGFASVGPGVAGRVGLWAHGDSFDNDASFFDEEDKAYAEWFEKVQLEQQQKKMEEVLAKRQAAKKAKKDEGVNTLPAIELRTTNRRRILNSKSNLLHTKFKALQVDVRSTFKRLQRALGVVNHTFTDAEKRYKSFLDENLLHVTRHSNDIVLEPHEAAGNTSSKRKKPVKQKLLPGTNSTATNVTTHFNTSTVWASILSGAWRRLKHTWGSISDNHYLRGSIPYPVLLDDDQMALFDVDLEHLATDAAALDIQLERAEAGLHDSEQKLRQVRLQKLKSEEEADEEAEQDSQKKKKQKSSDATSDIQRETRRRQEERMAKYSEMRLQMKDYVLQKLASLRQVLQTHRRHHYHILRAAASVSQDQIAWLKAKKSELQRAMTLNDESTSTQRQEMKYMSKESRRIQADIAELEAVEKAASALQRRRQTATKLDIVTSALRWNVLGRLHNGSPSSDSDASVTDGGYADAGAAKSSPASFTLSYLGLTSSEAQDLLLIPLLASVLLSWVVQMLGTGCSKATLWSARRVDARCNRLVAGLAPRNKEDVPRFNAQLFALRMLLRLHRAVLYVVALLRGCAPMLTPIVCMLFFEGNVLHRNLRTPEVGTPMSLMYRMTHVMTSSQRLLIVAVVAATIMAIYTVSDRVRMPSVLRANGSPTRGGGRRLGGKTK